MEAITKYKAIDGKEFTTEIGCLEYELLIKRVDKIMQPLQSPPKDDGCDFANGGGYIQHDPILLQKVKIALLKEMKKHIKHSWIQQSIDDPTIHTSYISRLTGDYRIAPLNSAWYRFECMDSNGREYGQPYFANHPNEAKQICLNQ